MSRLVIVSNRITLPTEKMPKSGGLAIVLAEALKRRALWLGWSGEVAEGTSSSPRIAAAGSMTYATLDLSPEEHALYYTGFANSCMYPLLLHRADLMHFRREEYDGYIKVCERFATALLPLLDASDVIWVHDNHLLSIIRKLRSAGARQRMGFFLHIPFPPAAIFAALPCAREILADWTSYDVIGFQTSTDRDNFFAACAEILHKQQTPAGEIMTGTHTCKAIVAPVGIDVAAFARAAEKSVRSKDVSRMKESLVGRHLMIGAERLDYSKGLPTRIEAFGRFLDKYPNQHQKISYLQIAPESRLTVRDYRVLKREIDQRVGEINGRYSAYDWVPIRYMTKSLSRKQLAGFFRSARVGLVTPLRDGFNLVCEEYVAAQDPADPGVLILSRFAGAAELLDSALIVNPYDTEAMADAINEALTWPLDVRKARWQKLMQVINAHTAADWCNTFLAHLGTKRNVAKSENLAAA